LEREKPVLVDIDNDGYLEAFVGNKNGDVKFFDNNLVGVEEQVKSQIEFKQLNEKHYISSKKSSELKGMSVNVYDVLGKAMNVSIHFDQEITVDLEPLNPGVYVGVVANGKLKESVRIVVN